MDVNLEMQPLLPKEEKKESFILELQSLYGSFVAGIQAMDEKKHKQRLAEAEEKHRLRKQELEERWAQQKIRRMELEETLRKEKIQHCDTILEILSQRIQLKESELVELRDAHRLAVLQRMEADRK